MRGTCDNNEGRFYYAHPFPRVFGYKRGSGFVEGDITDVRVYTLHIPHKVRT